MPFVAGNSTLETRLSNHFLIEFTIWKWNTAPCGSLGPKCSIRSFCVRGEKTVGRPLVLPGLRYAFPPPCGSNQIRSHFSLKASSERPATSYSKDTMQAACTQSRSTFCSFLVWSSICCFFGAQSRASALFGGLSLAAPQKTHKYNSEQKYFGSKWKERLTTYLFSEASRQEILSSV